MSRTAAASRKSRSFRSNGRLKSICPCTDFSQLPWPCHFTMARNGLVSTERDGYILKSRSVRSCFTARREARAEAIRFWPDGAQPHRAMDQNQITTGNLDTTNDTRPLPGFSRTDSPKTHFPHFNRFIRVRGGWQLAESSWHATNSNLHGKKGLKRNCQNAA
jgi:hypothetical protein